MSDPADARAGARVRALWASAAPPGDWSRDRTASLNQLLLAAVVFIVGVVVALSGQAGRSVLFFAGAFAVLALTGATLVVPWNRIAYGWMALVPALDVVAIGVMELSEPNAGFGLLWLFPTTWLAAGFGMLGLFGVIVSTGGIAGLLLFDPRVETGYGALLLPLVVAAVAVTSYLTARRSAAQRSLLATQAQLLHHALDRTRRQEQEVTEVLDAVDFGVIRISPHGSVAVTNDAHARLQSVMEGSHGSAEEAYRDDGVTRLPDDERPFLRALRGESFDAQLVWFGDPGGPRRALSITARRILADDGRDDGAVVVSRDVTAEVTALRARDELVASVSHELRTPLTSILGYLDLVIDDPEVPEAARGRLETAERNAERLLHIIADILAASSSSAGPALAISPVPGDAAEIVRASAVSLVPRADERDITIDLSDIGTAPVHADPLRLRQVVDNLVANAIAYNRHGGTVSLTTSTDGHSSWIQVRDTGVGIGEAERLRLFQRHYRAGRDVGRRSGGAGLGLAISRDIVRAQGGEITVRSIPGEGTTFVVQLPVEDRAGESVPQAGEGS